MVTLPVFQSEHSLLYTEVEWPQPRSWDGLSAHFRASLCGGLYGNGPNLPSWLSGAKLCRKGANHVLIYFSMAARIQILRWQVAWGRFDFFTLRLQLV
jgi:hypothetical protein